MKATEVKAWFKKTFGIPVRCETSPSKRPNPWIGVWIPCDKPVNGSHYLMGEPIKYSHSFPPELGQKCMRIVYSGCPGLEDQTWGGNIEGHRISMHQSQWEILFTQYGATR